MLSMTSALVAASLLVAPAAHGWQGTDHRSWQDRSSYGSSWSADRWADRQAARTPHPSTSMPTLVPAPTTTKAPAPKPTPAPAPSAPAPLTPQAGAPGTSTGGSGGAYTDRTSQTFTGAGRTSQYHIYAGHVDRTRPVKLMVHLHGDGAHEFTSPSYSVVRDYLAIAKQRNAVLVVPRTPNADRTWWRDRTASDWLAALVRDVYADYPVDRSDVWFSTFSGGSQALTQHFLPKHHGLLGGGGAVVVGGGTVSTGLAAAGAALGKTFEVHYVVGSADRGAGNGFDAYTAATRGATLFRQAGFQQVTLDVVPGEGHGASANDGPRVMSAHIDR